MATSAAASLRSRRTRSMSGTSLAASGTGPSAAVSDCGEPAGDENVLFADGDHAHRHQGQSDFFGQLLALENGDLNSGGSHARDPFVLVAVARRPLRRGDDGAIGCGQLHE